MTKISVTLDPAVALFYTRLAFTMGVSVEQVISDALFRLAGELSLQALENRRPPC